MAAQKIRNTQDGVTNTLERVYMGNFRTKVGRGFRISLPSTFRKNLGRRIIITRGIEDNLYIFDPSRWQALLRPITGRSFFNSKVRTILRYLISQAYDVKVDSLGRVVLPTTLRTIGKIPLKVGDELILAGLYNWIEVWDTTGWSRKMQEAYKEVGSIADILDNLEDTS